MQTGEDLRLALVMTTAYANDGAEGLAEAGALIGEQVRSDGGVDLVTGLLRLNGLILKAHQQGTGEEPAELLQRIAAAVAELGPEGPAS